MNRLTARNSKGLAYLVKVKPNEQAVDSAYPNTLRCILECFKQLAAYEDTGLEPAEIRQMQSEIARLNTLLAEQQKEIDSTDSADRELHTAWEEQNKEIARLQAELSGVDVLLDDLYEYAGNAYNTDWIRDVIDKRRSQCKKPEGGQQC
jgi:septal ring factor EnvC (AmiA/AmiB activator)